MPEPAGFTRKAQCLGGGLCGKRGVCEVDTTDLRAKNFIVMIGIDEMVPYWRFDPCVLFRRIWAGVVSTSTLWPGICAM